MQTTTQEKIQFTCPHCGAKLKVPRSMAGVTGPCPRCKEPISAPRTLPGEDSSGTQAGNTQAGASAKPRDPWKAAGTSETSAPSRLPEPREPAAPSSYPEDNDWPSVTTNFGAKRPPLTNGHASGPEPSAVQKPAGRPEGQNASLPPWTRSEPGSAPRSTPSDEAKPSMSAKPPASPWGPASVPKSPWETGTPPHSAPPSSRPPEKPASPAASASPYGTQRKPVPAPPPDTPMFRPETMPIIDPNTNRKSPDQPATRRPSQAPPRDTASSHTSFQTPNPPHQPAAKSPAIPPHGQPERIPASRGGEGGKVKESSQPPAGLDKSRQGFTQSGHGQSIPPKKSAGPLSNGRQDSTPSSSPPHSSRHQEAVLPVPPRSGNPAPSGESHGIDDVLQPVSPLPSSALTRMHPHRKAKASHWRSQFDNRPEKKPLSTKVQVAILIGIAALFPIVGLTILLIADGNVEGGIRPLHHIPGFSSFSNAVHGSGDKANPKPDEDPAGSNSVAAAGKPPVTPAPANESSPVPAAPPSSSAPADATPEPPEPAAAERPAGLPRVVINDAATAGRSPILPQTGSTLEHPASSAADAARPPVEPAVAAASLPPQSTPNTADPADASALELPSRDPMAEKPVATPTLTISIPPSAASPVPAPAEPEPKTEPPAPAPAAARAPETPASLPEPAPEMAAAFEADAPPAPAPSPAPAVEPDTTPAPAPAPASTLEPEPAMARATPGISEPSGGQAMEDVLVLPNPAASPPPSSQPASSTPASSTGGSYSASTSSGTGSGLLGPVRTTLETFLNAPTWQDRLPYVFEADSIRAEMADYYAANPYEPGRNYAIEFWQMDPAPEHGNPFYVYNVSASDSPEWFPVVVRDTPQGLKVDWGIYTEFSDKHFQRFQTAKETGPRRFRLVMRRTDYWGPDREMLKDYDTFVIATPHSSPESDLLQGPHAFVRKGTKLSSKLEKMVPWSAEPLAVILEVERKAIFNGGMPHLVIRELVTDGWDLPAAK